MRRLFLALPCCAATLAHARDRERDGFYAPCTRAKQPRGALIAGSRKVAVQGAQHFFEGQQDELVRLIVAFLDDALARRGR